MSRIGKKPIKLPEKVDIEINGREVTVKGPKGEISCRVDRALTIKEDEENRELIVERPTDHRDHKSLHGLYRSLLANMVEGVSNGYERRLLIQGVGYRAQLQGNKLVLNVGYSHPVTIAPPEGIEIEVPKNNQIVIKGVDKEQVGQIAARIRDVRKPEPYKGKGIMYENEQIIRKEGKTGK